MSEHEAVVEANRKFYRAFESLDLENMEKVWLKDRQIVCIHPGWRKLSGWGPVMRLIHIPTPGSKCPNTKQ